LRKTFRGTKTRPLIQNLRQRGKGTKNKILTLDHKVGPEEGTLPQLFPTTTRKGTRGGPKKGRGGVFGLV